MANSRLERVIDKVTNQAQKAYNKKRCTVSIHEALNTVNTIKHYEVNNIAGAILLIDQKKTFDSVFNICSRGIQIFRFW